MSSSRTFVLGEVVTKYLYGSYDILSDEVLNASWTLSSGASTWAAVAVATAQYQGDKAHHGPVSILAHNSYHSEFETCSKGYL